MKITALAGGVGGAKLAHGLAQCLAPNELTIIVNTGDDFTHWGLNISPDLDTVCYTLADLANPETGWGYRDETWNTFETIQRLGGDDWFRIGDRDLATHLERTRRLKADQPLSTITRDLCRAWGLEHRILPMSDQIVATIVDTVEQGEIAFQEYFVHQRCVPRVKGFRFAEIESAAPAPGVTESIAEADAIIFCPSNPWVSIDPILAVKGIRADIKKKKVFAVSPIVSGQALKGPAAKMFTELGIAPSALSVARHYQGLIQTLIIDNEDRNLQKNIEALGIKTLVTNTIMKTMEDRKNLAQDVLNLIRESL
jgi:LPPG:FO 2-phospho-L-lactate transferase